MGGVSLIYQPRSWGSWGLALVEGAWSFVLMAPGSPSDS